MGKINYMLPIYSNTCQININKLHKIIMTAARAAIGSFCFKKSVGYILKKCKWFDIGDLITYSSLNIIHKTIKTKIPLNMLSMFRDLDKVRVVSMISTRYIPVTVRFKQFYIYKFTSTYNSLDSNLKKKSVTAFKKEIKLMLTYRPISDTND